MLFRLAATDLILFFWKLSFDMVSIAPKTLDNAEIELIAWSPNSSFVDEATNYLKFETRILSMNLVLSHQILHVI